MAYTDWIPVLGIIPDKKELKILEFGIGAGTKALVEEFKSVFSFEILDNRKWFDKTVEQLKNYQNFQHEYIEAQELFEIHKEFAESMFTDTNGETNFLKERPSKPLIEILERSKKNINYSDFDVIFVDAGVYLRGEIVNFVMQFNPKYIMVHDTNGFVGYGYNLCISDKYKYFAFNTGDGTGLFVRQ